MNRAPLLLLLAVALSAGATTLPAGSEICRFRALDAENPFHRWLGSKEVTCVAAGPALEFPSGLWNVFARAEGVVSTAPLLIEGEAAPAAIEPALAPAAIVTPLLPEKHAGVVYVPRRGSAFPIAGARVTVPADEALWLFVLDEKSAPVAVIPIAPLAARTERTVDARGGGPSSIVGWLQVPEPDRAALPEATGLTSPSIHSGSREADPLPPPSLLHGAFFRIRDVAPGNAELRLDGRGWIPNRRVVKAQPGVTVAAAPLVVRAAGTLTVHWNADQDLPALDRSIGSCDVERDAPKLTISVSKCAPGFLQRPDGGDCAMVREETVTGFFGSMTFDDVVPGLYRAEMRFGKLPPSFGAASVRPLGVGDLRIHASFATVHGSVTRGGEPLGEKVRIEFPGGVGFAPAESEEYRGVIRPAPIDVDAQIRVAACDGSPRAVVLADKLLRPRTRFDIDIPANELAIHVSDTFTREALPGAMVKLDAMALRPLRVVFSATGTTGDEGNVVWTSVPVRELRLTVTRAGYEKRTVEPFTMVESGRHEVDVQLVPLRGTQGKIVSDRPFDQALVLWFSPAGSETERADLAADGTFVYTNWHTPDETMAVVSASHPLWVLHAPETGRRQSISLRFPNAPTVAFDVWLATPVPPTETRYIGLAIGGVRVPQPALAHHQTLRRDPPLMRGTGPHPFRDLLATGSIEVLLGPLVEEVGGRARGMDLFALPQFADAPRQRLEAGTTDVVFAVR